LLTDSRNNVDNNMRNFVEMYTDKNVKKYSFALTLNYLRIIFSKKLKVFKIMSVRNNMNALENIILNDIIIVSYLM